jgi:hypothetical protein
LAFLAVQKEMNNSTLIARTIWNQGIDATDFYNDAGYQELMSQQPPTNSRPLYPQSPIAVAYAAPGAGPVTLLTYTVPKGYNTVFTHLCIANIGGGFVDFSGGIIWRVLVNGAGAKNLGNITVQIGQISILQRIAPIILQENDVLTITAEVPVAQPAQGGTTAAVLSGYEIPVVAGGLQ